MTSIAVGCKAQAEWQIQTPLEEKVSEESSLPEATAQPSNGTALSPGAGNTQQYKQDALHFSGHRAKYSTSNRIMQLGSGSENAP